MSIEEEGLKGRKGIGKRQSKYHVQVQNPYDEYGHYVYLNVPINLKVWKINKSVTEARYYINVNPSFPVT